MQSVNPTKSWRPMIELGFAATLWGFGFIGSRWALEVMDASEVTFVRFAIAAVLGLPFVWRKRAVWKANLRLSFIPAVLLLATLLFQTWGLNYTTATKSGFITTLYVVFVPLLEAFLSRDRMPKWLWLCVAGAILGTALIVDIGFTSSLNRGDLLTLICALLATGQIYWMSQVGPRVQEPFAFNIFQAYWALLFCVPLVSASSLWNRVQNAGNWPAHVWYGFISLGIGSTMVAFFLQVRAQKRLPPTVSSLICLLESPFAAIFAFYLLGESFHGYEGLGAVLIFVSAIAATLIEANRHPKGVLQ